MRATRPASADLGATLVGDELPATPAMNATIESHSELLPPPANKPATIGNIAATIDSWSPAAGAPSPAARGSLLDQTIDSGTGTFLGPAAGGPDTGFSLAPPKPRGPGLTAQDHRIAQTIESHEIEVDLRKVTGVWSKTYSPESRPWQTVKGKESFSPRDSRLVIKSRALKTVTHEKAGGIDYELLGIIGEGGMGVVYSARQASIDRNVAIKMLKPEAASDRERREKFLSEAVVTGELDHPNIVPIYDLGSNEQNALFYAMKRVQGTPWSKVIAEKSLAENLEVLLKVADAVAFAHSRGVVHRDLKPENVMLGDFGEVLVMDWGLALSTPTFRKSESITQSTSMGGTPAYMAPEMAMGPVEVVGPLADVYLLGAILYEIMAGKPPHAGESVMSCLHAAARNQIQPTDAGGELLEIALHAMAANPDDRYPSVRDFQGAIRQYQDHSESIALSVRAEKDLADAVVGDNYQQFARALFAFEESLALWEGNDRARQGAKSARLAYATSAERKGDYDLASTLLSADDVEQKLILDRVTEAARERDARQGRLRNAKRMLFALAATVAVVIAGAYLQVRADRDRAVTAEVVANEQRDLAEKSRAVAVSERQAADIARQAADKARLAAETARIEEVKQKKAADAARAVAEQKRKDEAIARKDAEAAKAIAVEAKQAEEYEAYVARIGLAAAKIEENSFGYAKQLLAECPQQYRGWEWGRLTFLCEQGVKTFRSEGPVDAIAFAPDGRRFVSGSWDGKVRTWDSATGKMLHEFDYGAIYVHGVAWSPDGKRIAAAGNDSNAAIQVWDADTGDLIKQIKGHSDAALSVRFSEDGKRLLSTSYDNTARLWDLESGRELRKFEGHSWWVWSAAFSPDESRVVTASQDGTVRIWRVAASSDPATSAPAVFTGHRGPVYSAEFSHDGKSVASGGYDNQVLVWNPDSIQPFDYKRILSGEAAAPEFRQLEGHSAAVRSVRFSADDRMIASGSHDNSIRIWNASTGKAMKVLRGHAGWVRSVAFSPDSRSVLSGSHDYDARLWSIAGYEEMRVLRGRVLEGHDDAVLAAAFSHDGRRIATASRDRTARTWDTATGEELETFREGHEFLASSAVFSSDGKQLITAAIDNTTRIWDVSTGAQQFVLDGTGRSAALALSPDGTLVLTGSDDRTAQLWNAETGKLLHKLDELKSEVTAVAFSPDGKQFVTGDVSGRIKLWNTDDRHLLWTEAHHNGRITAVTFTPDGKRLLTSSIDKTVGQWDAGSGKELASLVLKHPDAVTSLSLDPGGKIVATSCADNITRLWSIENGAALGTLEIPEARLNAVSISPDGRKALTVGDVPDNADEKKRKAKDRRPLVRIWDLGSGKPLEDLKVRGTQVWAGVFSPDGLSVLTVGGNDARLWDVATGVQRMSFSPHGAVASVGFSPDGKRLVTASWDNSARIWNAETGKAELKLKDIHTRGVNAASFSPNGTLVLTASDDHTAKLSSAESADVVRSFEGHTDRVRAANFSSDGKRLVTGSNDKTARIWNADSGDELLKLTGHEWAVTSAVFSADGTRVMTGSEDNSARIWDAETGDCLLTLKGHTAAVMSVALSPDGRRALTASADNICKLWDAATGKEILTLKGHPQELTSVCFSADGRNVLTASRDGTAIVWLSAPWQEPAEK